MSLLFPTDVDKIAPALVKALGALKEPGRSGVARVPNRPDRKYMTLPDLLGAVRAAFTAQQLAVMQSHTYEAEGWVVVRTVILHESGQMVTTEPLTLRSAPDAQSVGSAGTYGKRYQLGALVGLAGGDEEDDDGETATQNAPKQQPAPNRHTKAAPAKAQTEPPGGHLNGSPQPGSASPQSIKYLWTLLRGLGTDDQGIRTWVAGVLNIDPDWSTKTLSQQQVSVLIERLKKTPAQAGDTTPSPEQPGDDGA